MQFKLVLCAPTFALQQVAMPQDGPTWPLKTPNVMRKLVSPTTEPTTPAPGQAAFEPPSARVPKDKRDIASEKMTAYFASRHAGVDVEGIAKKQRQADPERKAQQWEPLRQHGPKWEHARHRVTEHINNLNSYGGHNAR